MSPADFAVAYCCCGGFLLLLAAVGVWVIIRETPDPNRLTLPERTRHHV